MLHTVAFHLSGKVVALQLDNSTAKAYLYNQSGYSIPFSFHTCLSHIESGQQVWYQSNSSIHSYAFSL